MSLTMHNVTSVSEGDGVDVKRLFPLPKFMNFDPFVLFDHFNIASGRGFPDHPHRGFEAITYMFEGGINHKDNLGNESFVTSGGAQRFTAGKGIVHSEMPAKKGNSNGIQLWINLPKKLKRIEPSYQQVNADEFPIKEIAGGVIKVITGENSPLQLKTNVIYEDVKLENKAKYQLKLKQGMRSIIYVIDGVITINSKTVSADQALFIEDEIDLEFIATDNSRFLIFAGTPHGEEIHQHGPFVD